MEEEAGLSLESQSVGGTGVKDDHEGQADGHLTVVVGVLEVVDGDRRLATKLPELDAAVLHTQRVDTLLRLWMEMRTMPTEGTTSMATRPRMALHGTGYENAARLRVGDRQVWKYLDLNLHLPSLLPSSHYSSVGRAVDCRGYLHTQYSIGHWFDSGW